MKGHRYRITVEDESRLEKVLSWSLTPAHALGVCGAVVVCAVVMACLVLAFSPLRTLLPGYMKETERTATQMQLLRLDSLQSVYDRNENYLRNLRFVLDPAQTHRDTVAVSELTSALSPDSLSEASEQELRFAAMMREREKYNISVVAPLSAESLMFSPLADPSAFTTASKHELRGEVVLAKGTPVAAIADGTVITVSQSMRDGGSYVIIQHPKGFLSRTGRLGTVLVEPGDAVSGGQVIALPNNGNARRPGAVSIEMWHNGLQLVPFEYIGEPSNRDTKIPVIDEDVGRGRF